MSRLFWRIPITGHTCDFHGVPVVWRVTSSYITPRVVFTIRYSSQGALIYKDLTIYPESPEWSTFLIECRCSMLMTSTWLKISLTGWPENSEAICEFRS